VAIQDIYDAVMAYDEEDVARLVRAEIEAGTDLDTILNDGMIAALDEIGERFSEGTLFIPEMLMAAEAMQAGLAIVRPLLADTGAKPRGTVVIGTVKGDLHDIGKNLVGMMFEGAGYRLIDLGTDVDADTFVTAVQENDPDFVAMSSLLTTSMAAMATAVAAVRNAIETNGMDVKILVGGPPVNQEFADRIGADGYGDDAPGAVEAARSFAQV